METGNNKRCIFCMGVLDEETGKCQECGKTQWEYQWQNKFLTPGTVLKEKYEIGAALGSGGFGITYIAFDNVLQQRVAVKEFYPGEMCSRRDRKITVSEEAAESFHKGLSKFKEEASLIFGSFDMPGICNVKDYFEENGTAYIVEEYLSGGTLAEYIKSNGHISSEKIREIFHPVMQGLAKIHSMGIIHMDISPDNLLFDGEGALKLIDFGAAKQVTSTDEQMELKASYAPPEQYNDLEITGPWTDIYALCGTMYQALTEVKPDSALKRIKKDTLKPAADLAAVDYNLSEVLAQGLSLDIRKRFFSTANMMDKLGMDTEKSDMLTTKIRHLWGERWLNVVTEQKGDFEKLKEKKLTGHRVKRALKTAAVILAAIGIAAGCVALFIRINPVPYFNYKLDKAIERGDSSEEQLIPEGSKLYKEIMKRSVPVDWSDNVLDIAEEDVRELGLITDENDLFYLDKDTVIKILEHYIDKPFTPSFGLDAGYYSFIRLTDEKDDMVDVTTTYGECYGWDISNTAIGVTVKYDVVTERVTSVYVVAEREICKTVLREVFPYLVPDNYLTEEEIEQIVEDSYNDSFYIYDHPGFAISGSKWGIDEESNLCRISITRNKDVY